MNRRPVNIRRNVESFDDPYIEQESLQDNTLCSACGAVYITDRWYLPGTAPPDSKTGDAAPRKTLCPACRKMRDKMPGGVLTLAGGFVWEHKEEVLNLINNECARAQALNPLERIISMEASDGEIRITTTNEKLAQRIGRALHKAYSGEIEYKWSEDNKLVRVNWRRDLEDETPKSSERGRKRR